MRITIYVCIWSLSCVCLRFRCRKIGILIFSPDYSQSVTPFSVFLLGVFRQIWQGRLNMYKPWLDFNVSVFRNSWTWRKNYHHVCIPMTCDVFKIFVFNLTLVSVLSVPSYILNLYYSVNGWFLFVCLLFLVTRDVLKLSWFIDWWIYFTHPM